MAKKDFSYAQSIREIEDIMNSINNNELDIDDLSSKLKRATELIKKCKLKLHNTEKEVDQILQEMDDQDD